jgi:hypothetical protein
MMKKIIIVFILIFSFAGIISNQSLHAAGVGQIHTSAANLSGIIYIDHKNGISVALQNSGEVWSWKGNNPAAKQIVLENAIQITTKNLALKKDGTVWTWDSGSGNPYLKAKGIKANRNEPVQIVELKGIKKIESGDVGHLALDRNDEAWYWGEDGCMAWMLREDVESEACYHLSNEPFEVRYIAPSFTSIPAKVQSNIADIDIETGVMFATKTGAVVHIGVWDNVHMGEDDLMMRNIVKVAASAERHAAVGIDKSGYLVSSNEPKIGKQKGYVDVSAVANNSLPYLALHQDGTVWSGLLYADPVPPLIKLEGLSGIKQVKARSTNSGIALGANGIVYQWGSGTSNYVLPLISAVKPTKVQKQFSVVLNGEVMKLTSGPVISGGITLVPMRDLFEALHAKVDYNNGKITVTTDQRTIKLEVYRHEIDVNGTTLSLTQPPIYHNGKTYVPLRFIAETLGLEVKWDASSGTAIVSEVKNNA